MLGVVGRIKVNYCIKNERYEEIIDPQMVSEFSLKHCNQVRFQVEEITYVEDTVYGVSLFLVEPEYIEDEIFVGSSSANFDVEKLGVTGNISLCF